MCARRCRGRPPSYSEDWDEVRLRALCERHGWEFEWMTEDDDGRDVGGGVWGGWGMVCVFFWGGFFCCFRSFFLLCFLFFLLLRWLLRVHSMALKIPEARLKTEARPVISTNYPKQLEHLAKKLRNHSRPSQDATTFQQFTLKHRNCQLNKEKLCTTEKMMFVLFYELFSLKNKKLITFIYFYDSFLIL